MLPRIGVMKVDFGHLLLGRDVPPESVVELAIENVLEDENADGGRSHRDCVQPFGLESDR
jgi:hypothetical protein